MWFELCMWQCPTNLTDFNGAQTCTLILWWTGWCNTLSSNNGVVRWGISTCSTWDTLCTVEEGWSPPPSTVARVSSQQTWLGSTRRDQEYLQRGAVRELEVKWSTWWCGRKSELWGQENWQHILSNQPLFSLLWSIVHEVLFFSINCRVQWSGESYNQTNRLFQIYTLWHQQFEGELHNDVIAKVLPSSIHTHKHTPFASLTVSLLNSI